MKLALLTEWVVSASMLGGFAYLVYAHGASVRNDELVVQSREIIHASEALISAVKDAEAAHRDHLLTGKGEFLEQLRGGIAEAGAAHTRLARAAAGDPQVGSSLESIGALIQERFRRFEGRVPPAAAPGEDLLRGRIETLQRDGERRLKGYVAAARAARRNSGIAAVALGILGWLLFLWSSGRSRRHERVNSAITKQLRRYVQELERAHSIEAETAADLMRLNEELASAKDRAEHAVQARAQFLARISHDIRTPLSGIVGMSHLLMEGDSNPQNREYVLAIHSCANSLTLLLNDVLDLSKAESGKVVLAAAPFNLHDLCLDIANLFRAATDGKAVRLEFVYGADTPSYVVGDQQRLRQVITNLVGNAVKFTHEGAVGLHVSSVMTSTGSCRFRIKVTDTGIGIPAERMQSIFDPYEQGEASVAGRFGGTGLGLSICKHLAELMKGSIEVASVYGQGSTFTLTVPLVPTLTPGDPAPLPAAGEDDAVLAAGMRVLVAEDNRVNQTICRRILEKLGAAVDVAGNGLEAVEACVRRRYDLVLMDCNMPDMDGYEAARVLRESLKERSPRIVALTADATPESRRRCFEVGMDDWLVKPLRTESLRTVLRARETLSPV